jgi:hypothetical protein
VSHPSADTTSSIATRAKNILPTQWFMEPLPAVGFMTVASAHPMWVSRSKLQCW